MVLQQEDKYCPLWQINCPFKTLQQHIPGLTRYASAMARKHILLQGRGVPIEKETIGRVRFEEGQLEHFLKFI